MIPVNLKKSRTFHAVHVSFIAHASPNPYEFTLEPKPFHTCYIQPNSIPTAWTGFVVWVNWLTTKDDAEA